MERLRWTDDLINERMAAMDEKFDRLFQEMHALREEMKAGFVELRGEVAAVRTELRGEVASVLGEVVAFHRQVLFIVAAFAVGLLGLLGAVIAQL
jgi:hypothetical protein